MNSESCKNTSPVSQTSVRPGHRWWVFPWGYRESLAFVLGLLVVGVLLQLVRPLDFKLLSRPVNFVVLGLLLLPPLAALVKPKNKFLLWLGSLPLSVVLIAAFLLLSLVMGLTPQTAHPVRSPELPHRLGLTSMTSAWPFIFIQLAAMVTLSVALVLRLRRKGPKAAFLLNHLGLWLLLAAAGLGAADRRSYIIWLEEGQLEWRGRTGAGLVVELPLAIKLHDFSLEQYPPKLFVINKNDGKTLPEEKPHWYQIEPERNIPGQLLGWAGR